MSEKKSIKHIKTPLEKGPAHVVQSLVGIAGSTEEEVTSMIVKSWMIQNMDMLEKLGITIKVNGGNFIMDKSGEGWPYE